MKRLEEIRSRLAELKPEIAELGEKAEITDDEARSLDEKIAEFDTLSTEAAPLEERAAKLADIAAREIVTVPGDGARQAPSVHVKRDAFSVLEEGRAGRSPAEYRQALVDGLIRANEDMVDGAQPQAEFEKVIKRHAGEPGWAEGILARSRPEYATAFGKVLQQREYALTAEERTALSTVTSANGAYLLPTHLDPTIILTNDGTSNAVRAISRVVTLGNEKVWNGITSAGVTASWDGELAEVSDDSPTFGNPQITTYKAQAFVQASIEAQQDYIVESELLALFADAKDRLEGVAHCTGSGTNQPTGIFTSLDANTNVEITSTTAATIGEVDLAALYDGVPVRHRGKSTWLMNPIWDLAIRRLGTAVSYLYTVNLGDGAGQVGPYGKPIVLSDDAPEVTTTTALDQRIVFGNFENYVIVDKPGSGVIEYIPHLFNTSNNLPDGRRGWYFAWRTGGKSVNDLAFRLLLDKTSA